MPKFYDTRILSIKVPASDLNNHTTLKRTDDKSRHFDPARGGRTRDQDSTLNSTSLHSTTTSITTGSTSTSTPTASAASISLRSITEPGRMNDCSNTTAHSSPPESSTCDSDPLSNSGSNEDKTTSKHHRKKSTTKSAIRTDSTHTTTTSETVTRQHKQKKAKKASKRSDSHLSTSSKPATASNANSTKPSADSGHKDKSKDKSRRSSKAKSKKEKELSEMFDVAPNMDNSNKSLETSLSVLSWKQHEDSNEWLQIDFSTAKDPLQMNSDVKQAARESNQSFIDSAQSLDNSRHSVKKSSSTSGTPPEAQSVPNFMPPTRQQFVSDNQGLARKRSASVGNHLGTRSASHTALETVARAQSNRSMDARSAQSNAQRRHSNPEFNTMPGFVTFPESITVPLPTGLLGVVFKNEGKKTLVSCMREDSPMLNLFQVGMAVDTLTMPDGTEFRGLDSAELCKALHQSANTMGRAILLKSPLAKNLPNLATTKVLLPANSDAKDLGLAIVGDPATLKRITDTSPIYGKALPGHRVLTFGLDDGTCYYKLRGYELQDILQETRQNEGRFFVLKNFSQRKKTPEMPTATVETRRGIVGGLSRRWSSSRNFLFIDDSSGSHKSQSITDHSFTRTSLGQSNQGSSVSRIDSQKSIRSSDWLGTSSRSNVVEASAQSSHIASEKNRQLQRRHSNPELGVKPGYVTYPKLLNVALPTGQLGVVFKNNGSLASISCMKESSPMVNLVRVGMVVDTLSMPDGTEFRGLATAVLCKILNSTSNTTGRSILLKSPFALDLPSLSTTKIMLPVTGNARDLGLALVGNPATLKDIAATSPLFGKVHPGQQVFSIGLADGAEYNTLTSNTLRDVLEQSSGSDGRFLVFMNTAPRARTQKTEPPTVMVTQGPLRQGSRRFLDGITRTWASSRNFNAMDDSSGSRSYNQNHVGATEYSIIKRDDVATRTVLNNSLSQHQVDDIRPMLNSLDKDIAISSIENGPDKQGDLTGGYDVHGPASTNSSGNRACQEQTSLESNEHDVSRLGVTGAEIKHRRKKKKKSKTERRSKSLDSPRRHNVPSASEPTLDEFMSKSREPDALSFSPGEVPDGVTPAIATVRPLHAQAAKSRKSQRRLDLSEEIIPAPAPLQQPGNLTRHRSKGDLEVDVFSHKPEESETSQGEKISMTMNSKRMQLSFSVAAMTDHPLDDAAEILNPSNSSKPLSSSAKHMTPHSSNATPSKKTKRKSKIQDKETTPPESWTELRIPYPPYLEK